MPARQRTRTLHLYRSTARQPSGGKTVELYRVTAPGHDVGTPATSTIHTLFYVDTQSAGEFEFTMTPVRPVAITLGNPRVDVRRNVQRPPQ